LSAGDSYSVLFGTGSTINKDGLLFSAEAVLGRGVFAR